ncbi:hypothetical protein M422DRAFT_55512 [Sphaerobolus stellatus SS14]|uniref:Uncharacterized protein n=1 Tax=Sphaerobolus stellatus (strain SS14) TaxID=990650 RepID=A0A0C9TXF1_SPHS4|nr:hypothetical protein M422DRAFT_55512 [Sphaerobolus stellatus SS14]
MGRKSNAAKIFAKNASKARQKARKSSPDPVSVTPCESDSDAEYQPKDAIQAKLMRLEKEGLIPEWDDSESEAEEDIVDEDAEAEVRNDAMLLTFVMRLREAQELMDKVEREKSALRKRPKRYQGNSERSKRRWAQQRHDMLKANPNHKFITDWFKPLKKKEASEQAMESIDLTLDDDGEDSHAEVSEPQEIDIDSAHEESDSDVSEDNEEEAEVTKEARNS